MSISQSEKIVDWAKQNFPNKIEGDQFSRLLSFVPFICCSILFLLAVLGTIELFYRQGPICLMVILLPLTIYLEIVTFNLWRRCLVYVDSNGVKTQDGKIYQWSNLSHIEYHPFFRRTTAGIMVRSKDSFIIRLIFEDGRASSLNNQELDKIFITCPVSKFDKRDEGWL